MYRDESTRDTTRKMISPLTESESDYSGISSLSGGSKQERKFKNEGTSIAVATVAGSGSAISQTAQGGLQEVPKNIAKKGLKRRADEDEDEGGQNDPDTVQINLEAQLEYSRVSAARACKRQIERVADLEEKVCREKQKTNDILRAQVEMLRDQNEFLLAERRRDFPAAAPSAPSLPTVQVMSAQVVLEGLSLEQLLQIEQLWQMDQR
jgi:hypothetical protein